jgi:hypothetical protein
VSPARGRGLVVIAWNRLTGLAVLPIVAISLMVLGGISVFAEIARRSDENLATDAVDIR